MIRHYRNVKISVLVYSGKYGSVLQITDSEVRQIKRPLKHEILVLNKKIRKALSNVSFFDTNIINPYNGDILIKKGECLNLNKLQNIVKYGVELINFHVYFK